MGAFHGTWMWTSGTDTVKVYLTTKKVLIPIDNYYTDFLVGWHIYKKGNTVIESSYGNINNVDARTIDLWNNNMVNTKAEGAIIDLSKASKSNFLYLALNGSQNQLTWRCTESPGVVYASQQMIPPAGVTLPRNMVLTRQ